MQTQKDDRATLPCIVAREWEVLKSFDRYKPQRSTITPHRGRIPFFYIYLAHKFFTTFIFPYQNSAKISFHSSSNSQIRP